MEHRGKRRETRARWPCFTTAVEKTDATTSPLSKRFPSLQQKLIGVHLDIKAKS